MIFINTGRGVPPNNPDPFMDILFLLVPLSVVLAIAIGAAFWLAVEGGQFDDLERQGLSVSADDDRPPPRES